MRYSVCVEIYKGYSPRHQRAVNTVRRIEILQILSSDLKSLNINNGAIQIYILAITLAELKTTKKI